jgi:hypothetical protein
VWRELQSPHDLVNTTYAICAKSRAMTTCIWFYMLCRGAWRILLFTLIILLVFFVSQFPIYLL